MRRERQLPATDRAAVVPASVVLSDTTSARAKADREEVDLQREARHFRGEWRKQRYARMTLDTPDASRDRR